MNIRHTKKISTEGFKFFFGDLLTNSRVTSIISYIKDLVRPIYYFIEHYKVRIAYSLKSKKIVSAREIPIIINSFNRLTFLKKLIHSLERKGIVNIYIIDNKSTYPPLLEYYKEIPYEVIFLNENLGFTALWKSKIHKRFCYDYYVYTDPDVELIDECPDNFLEMLLSVMQRDKKIDKIGLSLKIDDLPEYFKNKQSVIDWEKQYYQNRVAVNYFKANVDTTFALYRPGLMYGGNIYLNMLRADFPLQIRHLPWYLNSEDLSAEEKYYIDHAIRSTHWTKQAG